MLIINDSQRLLAGVVSLNEPCPYCSQPLRSYPLIMSDDAALVDQAFHGTTQVSCPLGPVVAVSRRKGQLRVMIRLQGDHTTRTLHRCHDCQL